MGARVGLHQRGENVSVNAVADPHLGAVDHVAAFALGRPGADRLQVRAAVGLGQRDRAAQLAVRTPWKVAPLLGLGTEALDDGGHDESAS